MKVGIFLGVSKNVGSSHRKRCKLVEGHHGPRGHLFSKLHTILWDSGPRQQGNSSSVGTETGCEDEYGERHIETYRGGQSRDGSRGALEASGGNTGKVRREPQQPARAPWKHSACSWGEE